LADRQHQLIDYAQLTVQQQVQYQLHMTIHHVLYRQNTALALRAYCGHDLADGGIEANAGVLRMLLAVRLSGALRKCLSRPERGDG
jgi:hypothetical protein